MIYVPLNRSQDIYVMVIMGSPLPSQTTHSLHSETYSSRVLLHHKKSSVSSPAGHVTGVLYVPVARASLGHEPPDLE